jgi:protein O-GlcNAc transferase
MNIYSNEISPCTKNGYITYCSSNNYNKLNKSLLKAWNNILLKNTNSKLIIRLRNCKNYINETLKKNIMKMFDKIQSDRILLMSESKYEWLTIYKLSDVLLDTFPYSCTTTTMDALLNGLPVITYYRPIDGGHAHNVSASILSKIDGMSHYIAKSYDDYINIASNITIKEIEQLRKTIPLLLNDEICNQKKFVDKISNAFIKMWSEYVSTCNY